MKKTARKRKTQEHKRVSRNAYFRMAIMSSRGQVTVPQDVRELMHIKRGSVVGFEPTKKGILMVVMKVTPRNPYTKEEWEKIDRLSKGEGKAYNTAEEAKKHIADL